jgi:hypothetical protein
MSNARSGPSGGHRRSRNSPARGHRSLKCWVSDDAEKLLAAECARTGKTIDWIVYESVEKFVWLPGNHQERLVEELGADWLEDTEIIEELGGVGEDRELSRRVNASLVYALERGIE